LLFFGHKVSQTSSYPSHNKLCRYLCHRSRRADQSRRRSPCDCRTYEHAATVDGRTNDRRYIAKSNKSDLSHSLLSSLFSTPCPLSPLTLPLSSRGTIREFVSSLGPRVCSIYLLITLLSTPCLLLTLYSPRLNSAIREFGSDAQSQRTQQPQRLQIAATSRAQRTQ
jgi:hypothetical protein